MDSTIGLRGAGTSRRSPGWGAAGTIPTEDEDNRRVGVAIREFRRVLQAWGQRGHPYARSIDVRQADALDIIAERGPSSIGTIAEALRIENSTATRAMNYLVDQALVEKTRVDGDGRMVLVKFTPAGEKVYAALVERRGLRLPLDPQ